MKRLFSVFLVLVVLFFYSHGYAEESPVLAKVGEKKITLTDFNRILGYYDIDKQKALDEAPQKKISLLKRYVQANALSNLARAEGFDKRPDIKEKTDMLVNDFFATEYLRVKVSEFFANSNIQENELKTYYKAHKDEFTTPEMVKARHILVRVEKTASEEDKKKAKERIGDILMKVKGSEDFARLASELSEDPGTKEKGGDLGFFQKGSMLPEFEAAAFSLKPGEISGIVETQFGYHVIKVEEKKASVVEPFEKVSQKIKDKILSDRKTTLVQKLIDKAMKDSNVEMNLEPLMPKN